MEDKPAEDDDIDFSMIGPGNDMPRELDFSLNDLLNNSKQQPERKEQNETESVVKENKAADGSFMRDLGKMEQELSYETDPYDIYELSERANEFVSNGEYKQEETCTRTINNLTKTIEKVEKVIDNDFQHLILDIADDKITVNFKVKESFQDHYDGSILKTKKISINSVFSEKIEKLKGNDTLTSTSRKSILATERLTNNKVYSNSKTKTDKSGNSSSMKRIETIKKTPSKKSVSKNKNLLRKNEKHKSKSNQKSFVTKLKKKEKEENQVLSEYFGFEQKQVFKGKSKKKVNQSSSKGKKIIFSQSHVFLS